MKGLHNLWMPALLWLALLSSCQSEPAPAAETEAGKEELQYQGPVTDHEDILTKGQEEILEEKIDIIEKGRDIKLAIITVKEVPDSLGVLGYATWLGNAWEIGGAEGNALVILISANEGKTGIAVGRKLENIYTDEVTGRILNKEMLPFFRTGYYQQGLLNMLDALAETDSPVAKK